MNELREFLYPLGFVAQLVFTGRICFQWLMSEAKKKSVVPPLFWKFSLVGNLLMTLHAFLQMQFHIFAIQSLQAVISWRNLDFRKPQKEQATFNQVILYFFLTLLMGFMLFFLQDYYCYSMKGDWMRVPEITWFSNPHAVVHWYWHLFGALGLMLFSSRFWIQWWRAEKKGASSIGPSFWWVSLIGNAISLSYFLYIRDPVNILGLSFTMIPYVRNLLLLAQEEKKNAVALKV